MTTMSRNSITSTLHPERGKRGSLLTLLGWLAICPLLTSCIGTAIPLVPPQPTQQDAWLSFKFVSGLGSPGCGSYPGNCGLTDQTEAVAYYNALGIASPGTYTFINWLKDSGALNVPQNQIASAIYFNKLDLQFGRNMHCWQNGQAVGCYVVNYGPPPLNPDGTANPAWPNRAQAIDDANNGRNPFATVAMVFTPCTATPCQPNNVSFYVFDNTKEINNDPTTAPLSNVAALDTEGAKTVPRMCMGCHGGSYDTNTHSATGAQFLPFDVISFGLDSSSPQAFLDLNAFVLATNPNQAIKDFVAGTYPGLTGAECQHQPLAGGVCPPFTQDVANANVTDFIPLNWNSNALYDGTPEPKPTPQSVSTMYNSLVKTYCRMCHLAQARDFATYNDSNNKGNFQGAAALIEQYSCVDGDMPHMEVPFGPQNNINLAHGGIGLWNDVDAQAQQALHDFLQSVNHSTTCKTQ